MQEEGQNKVQPRGSSGHSSVANLLLASLSAKKPTVMGPGYKSGAGTLLSGFAKAGGSNACSAMDFDRDPSRPPDRCIVFVRPLVLDVITVVLIRSIIGYVV
jgi:hypothetical protein